LGTERNSDVNK